MLDRWGLTRSSEEGVDVPPLHKPSDRNTKTPSSPRPSPPVEEREKTKAVQGRYTGSSEASTIRQRR